MRTVEFLPGINNALHCLQNRCLSIFGICVLYLALSCCAIVMYLFAYSGLFAACSKSVCMRSFALFFCSPLFMVCLVHINI